MGAESQSILMPLSFKEPVGLILFSVCSALTYAALFIAGELLLTDGGLSASRCPLSYEKNIASFSEGKTLLLISNFLTFPSIPIMDAKFFSILIIFYHSPCLKDTCKLGISRRRIGHLGWRGRIGNRLFGISSSLKQIHFETYLPPPL